MRIYSKIIVALTLTISLISPTVSANEVDVSKPDIKKISASSETVAPGEKVLFSVEIADASPITFSSISIRPIERDALEKTIYLKLKKENGLYEGSYTVPLEAFNEKWKVTTVYAKDVHGNYSSLTDKDLYYDNWESTVQIQIFNGIDVVKPIISGLEPVTIDTMQAFDANKNVRAIDDIDGDLTSFVEVSGIINPLKEGNYTLTYKVSDRAGNETTEQRQVSVIDQSAPVLTFPKDTTIYAELPFDTLNDVTAFDAYEGDVTNNIQVVKDITPNVFGSQQIIYKVSDKRGNNSTLTRSITVLNLPNFNLQNFSDVAVLKNQSFDPYEGVAIMENGQTIGKIHVSGQVNNTEVGQYELTYTFQTSTKQTVTKTRTIHVVNSLQPFFTGIESIKFPFGQPFQHLQNVKAFDATGRELHTITSSYSGDITLPGTHEIQYQAYDRDGRSVEVKRFITVESPTVTFIDVPSMHPYFLEIESMKARGIINGYPGNMFKPSVFISRQHVAALITRSGVSLTPIRKETTFKDVPPTHRYYTEIMALYRAGIIDGTNGYFNPTGDLTRAQLAKILVNTFNLQLQTASVRTFSDVKNDWTKPFIDILASNNYTTGSNGKFMPSDKVSRMHYTVFMYRILQDK